MEFGGKQEVSSDGIGDTWVIRGDTWHRGVLESAAGIAFEERTDAGGGDGDDWKMKVPWD